MTIDEVRAVYEGSSADATRALYASLSPLPRGLVAINLLRACKASERAKKYRGRRYTGAAYDRKDWAIGELCDALRDSSLGVAWGWGRDEKAVGYENVLYVDLPGAGQVSFHAACRRDGPDYPGRWDGARDVAAKRIILWAHAVLHGMEVQPEERHHERQDGTEGAAGPRAAGGEAGEAQGSLGL